mmetsp:Transcript_31372/g.68589  ORF Transcript_31372/g.68589 Transcript_31372/m.68589 type:complete len:289 (+) Transcript_31372:457-1323(+)
MSPSEKLVVLLGEEPPQNLQRPLRLVRGHLVAGVPHGDEAEAVKLGDVAGHLVVHLPWLPALLHRVLEVVHPGLGAGRGAHAVRVAGEDEDLQLQAALDQILVVRAHVVLHVRHVVHDVARGVDLAVPVGALAPLGVPGRHVAHVQGGVHVLPVEVHVAPTLLAGHEGLAGGLGRVLRLEPVAQPLRRAALLHRRHQRHPLRAPPSQLLVVAHRPLEAVDVEVADVGAHLAHQLFALVVLLWQLMPLARLACSVPQGADMGVHHARLEPLVVHRLGHQLPAPQCADCA